MSPIRDLIAREILDSRGRPTVEVRCTLEDGAAAAASVPAGASSGQAEALELRDGDPARYGGWGCRRAVAQVSDAILPAVRGRAWTGQAELDEALCRLDGTPNKARLGANAVLGVSLAYARAVAASRQIPLYRHFAELAEVPLRTLPRLTINLFSGGKHAGGQVPIQDVLVVPLSAPTIDEGLAAAFAVYESAVRLTAKKYRVRGLKADEGGLAPPFPSPEAMLGDAVEAIAGAGLVPGKDVALAVDVASSHFFEDGVYRLGGETLDSRGMIGRIREWVQAYPIVSVEDGLGENDWAHWPELRRALPARCLVLGDDLLCTNPARIARAAEARAVNALLLKVNQIGTLSEAAEARRTARGQGWAVTVSARSGETEDDWLADLATAWGDQIKVGSIRQSDRLAKYNRLLAIERETGLPVAPLPGA